MREYSSIHSPRALRADIPGPIYSVQKFTPWPRPPNTRWHVYGHPDCDIILQRAQPIQRSLGGVTFNFLVQDVIESLEEWSVSGRAGRTPDVVQYNGLETGKYKFGTSREHTAEIHAAWLPFPRSRAVPQDVAEAAIHEMRFLIANHGVAELMRLELLIKGVLTALIKLMIVTDERNGVGETTAIA